MEEQAVDTVDTSAENPAEQLDDKPDKEVPSWILVEESAVKHCYNVIHNLEVFGNIDLTQNKVAYVLDGMVHCGFIHLVSYDRKVAEDERKNMILESTSPYYPDFWALVTQGNEQHTMRIVMVGCKKLVDPQPNQPNAPGFLLGIDKHKGPCKMLYMLESEHGLREILNDLQKQMVELTMCPEKDNAVEAVGLDKAYFLVQYFEDALTMVFSIVRYRDTLWKEDNKFPCIVAYIKDQAIAHQCVILRKSFDPYELVELINVMRTACNQVNYAKLRKRLKAVAVEKMKNGG